MSVSDYISANYPYALAASQQTGVPVNFILGQTGLETGWGSSNNYANGNNPGGISDANGNPLSYSSLAEGWQAYTNTLSSSRYAAAIQNNSDNPYGLASALQTAGYSTNPNYGNVVAAAVGTASNAMGNLGLSNTSAGGSGTLANQVGSAITGAVTQLVAGSLAQILIIVIGLAMMVAGMYMFAKDQGIEVPIPIPPIE